MSNKLISIPLFQLKKSEINVRKTEPLAGVEELAASILSKGVLENLVVRPRVAGSSEEPDKFDVIAGSRRLAALKLLAKRKKIARNHPVPCLVLNEQGGADLVEVSLAENTIRAPVHPADQFDAFASLQKGGLSSEDIAARFGISSLVVSQRLKLAAVSPKLMGEYRAGELTLEQLMAFTISDDHALQEEVWFSPAFGELTPQAIRRLLTRSQVEGHDRRARFIGCQAYEAAGGAVLRDLFRPEDEGYFSDSQLLDRLVAVKLQAEAETIKGEGWGWIEIAPETDYEQLSRFGRLKMVDVELPEQEETRLRTLCDRYDELVSALEDEPSDDATAELEQVSVELEALRVKKEVWKEEEKAGAGAFVSIDADGNLQVARGLIKIDRSAKANGRRPDEAEEKDNGATRPPRGFSDALLAELSAQRTVALRAMLAANPRTAITALLEALILFVFYPESAPGCVEIVPRSSQLTAFSPKIGESKAAIALLERRAKWQQRLPDRRVLWQWLENLSEDERAELLAYCTGLATNAVHSRGGYSDAQAHAELLASAVGLDMADWWRPTLAGYFSRISKADILKAVSEATSAEAARHLESLKKDEMAERAEDLLANSRWLPLPLRTRPGSPSGGPDQREAAE